MVHEAQENRKHWDPGKHGHQTQVIYRYATATYFCAAILLLLLLVRVLGPLRRCVKAS